VLGADRGGIELLRFSCVEFGERTTALALSVSIVKAVGERLTVQLRGVTRPFRWHPDHRAGDGRPRVVLPAVQAPVRPDPQLRAVRRRVAGALHLLHR